MSALRLRVSIRFALDPPLSEEKFVRSEAGKGVESDALSWSKRSVLETCGVSKTSQVSKKP